MLTHLIEWLAFGPTWRVIAVLVVVGAPGWFPIVWALGWWAAGALAVAGLLGILTLGNAISHGRWRPW
jgi:hypothetical protein